VRSERSNNIVTTTPVAVTIVPANPGIFTRNADTHEAMAFHSSSNATQVVSIDGTVTTGDIATVTVEDRSYSYTAVDGDTLDTVRDNLVQLINQDPKVTAEASGQFDRITIKARVEGPEGNGIAIGGSASSGATVIVTPLGLSLCCANVAGTPVTQENPAVPGETIVLYATGLGVPIINDTISSLLVTGRAWPQGGPVTTPPFETGTDPLGRSLNQSVSSLAGGKTADVITASLLPGTVGTFAVVIHLNSDLPDDPAMAITIAQDLYVSNVATVPIVNPPAQ
jgi:hypothetical protein